MSQQFFNRIVKVTIGTPTKSGALNIGLVLQSPLRITFDCTKTEYSLANIGTITINNLSQETRNAIRQEKEKKENKNFSCGVMQFFLWLKLM